MKKIVLTGIVAVSVSVNFYQAYFGHESRPQTRDHTVLPAVSDAYDKIDASEPLPCHTSGFKSNVPAASVGDSVVSKNKNSQSLVDREFDSSADSFLVEEMSKEDKIKNNIVAMLEQAEVDNTFLERLENKINDDLSELEKAVLYQALIDSGSENAKSLALDMSMSYDQEKVKSGLLILASKQVDDESVTSVAADVLDRYAAGSDDSMILAALPLVPDSISNPEIREKTLRSIETLTYSQDSYIREESYKRLGTLATDEQGLQPALDAIESGDVAEGLLALYHSQVVSDEIKSVVLSTLSSNRDPDVRELAIETLKKYPLTDAEYQQLSLAQKIQP